jgi:outer membrane protein OmpA-like peptidoglycan-associated protein
MTQGTYGSGSGEKAIPFAKRFLQPFFIFCLVGLVMAGCAGNQVRKGNANGAEGEKAGTGAWRAVIGGMSGIAAGDVITQYMDSQARELAQVSEARRINDGIVVTLRDVAIFDFDSAELKPESHADLRKLAAVFNKYPKTQLTVAGHTDNLGSISYNIQLSERRAKAVADFLAVAGVAPGRIRVMGLGFERPLVSNDSAEGRAKNRRVEIHIAPSQELRNEDRPPPE